MVEKGMENGIENGFKKVFEQMELNRHEAAATFERFEAERKKDLEQREQDKEEALWLRQRDKEDILRQIWQESPQRSTHQPTDVAAHRETYTPKGRQPHGGDAALTDSGDATGVGGSL